jgi:hypothetical protein
MVCGLPLAARGKNGVRMRNKASLDDDPQGACCLSIIDSVVSHREAGSRRWLFDEILQLVCVCEIV